MAKRKIIIGKKDWLDLPDLDLQGVKAKIDTGADRSSIHATRIRIVEEDQGRMLHCQLLHGKKYVFREWGDKVVKSSNGIAQHRYVVKLRVVIFGRTFVSSFTLANRTHMRFPILLGKTFLRQRFLVDVSRSDLSRQGKIIEV